MVIKIINDKGEFVTYICANCGINNKRALKYTTLGIKHKRLDCTNCEHYQMLEVTVIPEPIY